MRFLQGVAHEDRPAMRHGAKVGVGAALAAERYEAVRALFEQALGTDTALFNEYHALIVRHAKDICRARRPLCAACVLRAGCPGAV
jgi:endonuclease-3 related protein